MTAAALLRLEARVQWRYGAVALLAALAVAWTGLLLVLPGETARSVAPWLLMLETALVGTTLVGALVIFERDLGMRAALAMTPARLGTRLAVKVAVLGGLVLCAAVPIALAGRPVSGTGLLAVLAGVGLTAILTMLVAVAVAAHRQSVITFMIALPLVLLPLVAPPLLHAAGVGHPLLYAVPTTGAMDLVRAGYDAAAPGLGWAAAWLGLACVVAAVAAHHQLRRVRAAGAARSRPDPARPRRPARPARPAGGPVRSFLRTDLASVRRDPLLLLIGVSTLLFGSAIRLGYQPAHTWLIDAHGFDLDPYRPLLLGVAVLLHIPVTFGMVGALLVLDDADDRALLALRASPLTLPRYLGYRAGLVTVASWTGLVVAVPLTGLAPVADWPQLAPAALLAGLVAPVFMFAVLALAGNKVEGVAAVKLLGLPCYAPLAGWWLTGPAGWVFAVVPTWWVLQAQWTTWPYVLGGLLVTAGMGTALARRATARLVTP